ncbi:hypothetical protein BH10BAC3_BH10BAC3_14320 [soil metagenome]
MAANISIFETLINIQQRLSIENLNSAKLIYRISGAATLVL